MVDNCKNIMQLLEKLDNSPDSKIKIESSDNTTISNEFIVTLKDQDYTIGNAIVYFLYEDYFIKDKSLSFVGFRVPHPHIPNGVIRMAFQYTRN